MAFSSLAVIMMATRLSLGSGICGEFVMRE